MKKTNDDFIEESFLTKIILDIRQKNSLNYMISKGVEYFYNKFNKQLKINNKFIWI